MKETAYGESARKEDADVEPDADGDHTGDALAARGCVVKFNMGDIVVGVATKFKQHYHNKKAKITAILAKHYKVEMLEGRAVGSSHKYLHASVSAVASDSPPHGLPMTEDVVVASADAAAASSNAGREKCLARDILVDIEKLWH